MSKKYASHISVSGLDIILDYEGIVSKIPQNIICTNDFIKYTSAKTREKVFAKWISDNLESDEKYISLKKKCSEMAGRHVCQKILTQYCKDNLFKFFQIYPFEYYYAKSTLQETTILRVPSIHDFNKTIEFADCHYDVPSSQLNIITTFKNLKTGKTLAFRNECRFSHGQFNGTPEAKLYVVKDTPLYELYDPIT